MFIAKRIDSLEAILIDDPRKRLDIAYSFDISEESFMSRYVMEIIAF